MSDLMASDIQGPWRKNLQGVFWVCQKMGEVSLLRNTEETVRDPPIWKDSEEACWVREYSVMRPPDSLPAPRLGDPGESPAAKSEQGIVSHHGFAYIDFIFC